MSVARIGLRKAGALARFLHRNEPPGEKEKNALAAGRLQLASPKRRRHSASRSLGPHRCGTDNLSTMSTPSTMSVARLATFGTIHHLIASGLAMAIGMCAAAAQWQPAKGPLATRWARDVSPTNAHPEYPRPQMVRDQWLNLNGLWDYAIRPKGQPRPDSFDGKILVPFPVESHPSRLEGQAGSPPLRCCGLGGNRLRQRQGDRHPPRRLRCLLIRDHRRPQTLRGSGGRRGGLRPHEQRQPAPRQTGQRPPRHLPPAASGRPSGSSPSPRPTFARSTSSPTLTGAA